MANLAYQYLKLSAANGVFFLHQLVVVVVETSVKPIDGPDTGSSDGPSGGEGNYLLRINVRKRSLSQFLQDKIAVSLAYQ